MEHERDSLGGGHRVEHNQQRQTDGVGEQGLLVWIGVIGEGDDRIRYMSLREPLPPDSPGAEHVQAHPPEDRRQPGSHVLDGAGIVVADPQPRFLESVIGFGRRSEHPGGDGVQVPSVLLEPFGQPLALVHQLVSHVR